MADTPNNKQETNILIVEDERIVAKDVQNTLKKLGYNVPSVVSSGKEAIKKAKERSFDLVLMDIGLKGDIDGIEAASKIRSMGIPVIYLTAYSDETTLQRAKITEPFGYILKPFEERELYTSIEMAIYKHKMEQKLKKLKDFAVNIVESTPLGIVVIDLDKKITALNKVQEEMIGIKADELIGKTLYGEYMQGLADQMSPLLDTVMKDGKTIQMAGIDYTNEYLNSCNTFDISISPLISDEEITGAVIATSDVTEKKMLNEMVAILEKKENTLTEKDKLVYYGLLRYPQLNDIELSQILRIKRSTLTGIRNKLKRNGYYTTIRVPNLPALGFELITFKYGRLISTVETKVDHFIFANEVRCPGYVYMSSTESEYFSINVCSNITTYREKTDPIEAEYEKMGIIKDFDVVQFPFGIAHIKNFYDYSRAVKNWFNLKLKDEVVRPQWETKKTCKLTDNEAMVLYALTKYPDYTDREISHVVGLNKITVNQIKKRLIENQLIQKIRLPNLEKIGSQLMLLVHARFNPAVEPEVRNNILANQLPNCSTYVESQREAIMLSPFKNFSEYKIMFDRCMKIQNKNEIFLEDPKTLLVPINKLKINKIDFGTVLKERYKINLE